MKFLKNSDFWEITLKNQNKIIVGGNSNEIHHLNNSAE